jgi:hypothetical protein
MPNTRVAQIGQIAINQPIYEVLNKGKKYAFMVNKMGKLEMVTPTFLKQIGLYSVVADQFQAVADLDIKAALNLNSFNVSGFEVTRFPYTQLGSGLAFVSQFKLHSGWANFNPTNTLTI